MRNIEELHTGLVDSCGENDAKLEQRKKKYTIVLYQCKLLRLCKELTYLSYRIDKRIGFLKTSACMCSTH